MRRNGSPSSSRKRCRLVRRAVFLDRDGVLNDAILRNGRPHPPTSLAELTLASDADDAIARLKLAGFVTICVTNQPDVARGTLDEATARQLNSAVVEALGLDDLIACFHDDLDGCSCRKPRPGMILEGAARWHVDPNSSYLVGDRWRDIEAGKNAGCRTIWIDRGYRERAPEAPDARVASLTEAVEWILEHL